jgi:hypothetical protein
MLLLLALLVAPSNVSSFRSMSHVSLQESPFKDGIWESSRTPLFTGKDMFENLAGINHAVGKLNIRGYPRS